MNKLIGKAVEAGIIRQQDAELLAKAEEARNDPPGEEQKISNKNPYGAKLVMRHYSQVLPRDFDLNPNFDIIKFNIIKGGKFNYKSLP